MSSFFFFSSRRRHTIWTGDWSSDVCSSDLLRLERPMGAGRSLARLRSQQRLMQPVLVGQPAQAVPDPVQPAGVHILLLAFGAGLDVPTVDPDGRRAREAALLGGRLVGDVDHP